MYQYDMDKSEGRWMVEKCKYMIAELFKQMLFNRETTTLFTNSETTSAIMMCSPFGFQSNIKEEYKDGDPVGWFCEVPIYIDTKLPSFSWEFRTTTQDLMTRENF